MWFFNVGLSGEDGTLNNKWPVKTLETLLTSNKHIDVRVPVLLAFVVLHLVSSVTSQEIGCEEIRNDLFCVTWDVKS